MNETPFNHRNACKKNFPNFSPCDDESVMARLQRDDTHYRYLENMVPRIYMALNKLQLEPTDYMALEPMVHMMM